MIGGLAAALSATALASPASAQATDTCAIIVRPAAKPTSVGEDFDAVKRVDQDLRDYAAAAGKPLDWLTPERQLALIQQLPLAALLQVNAGTISADPQPITRQEAVGARPRPGDGCAVEVLIPQVILERGGLAQRSLRIFGVVRRYPAAGEEKRFSGFTAAPMPGFKMKEPGDLPAATSLVETSFKQAVEKLLASSSRPPKK